MIEINPFPHEYFIEINLENQDQEKVKKITNKIFYEGRITIYKINQNSMEEYYAEVDILLKESRKIFQHVGIFNKYKNEEEAISEAYLKLSQYLRQQIKN